MRSTKTLIPLLALASTAAAANSGGSVVINEIRADQPGLDIDEFVELSGAPGASLAGMTYIVLGESSGGANSGVIEDVIDLTGQTIPGSGYFVMAGSAFTLGVADLTLPDTCGASGCNIFENDQSSTHLLVMGFSGAQGDDLDTDDDGVLDVTPWTMILDDVAIDGNDDDQQNLVYSSNVVLAFGVGPAADVAKIERCPDTTGPWVQGESEVTLLEDTPGSANLCPPPAFEECTIPGAISGVGIFVFDNTNGTTSGYSGVGCTLTIEDDVFLIWTAPAAGTYQFDTCGTSFDTRLAVHSGFDCATDTCLGENDDSCGLQSSVTVAGILNAGNHMIQIGSGVSGVNGVGLLNITLIGAPPANDDCSTPTAISGTGSFAYDRLTATTSGFDGGSTTCASAQGFSAPHYDVFFAWTATATGAFVFDNCTDGMDTDMNVHVGADCSATCLTNNDDGVCQVLGESSVTVGGVNVGDQYLIQIGNWDSVDSPVNGTLNVSVGATPPANDDCSAPTAIAGEGSFAFDTTNATDSGFDGGDPATCANAQGSTPPKNDLFFVWTAPCSGDYLFTTCNQTIDTQFAIHAGSDCSATCIAEEGDNDGTCGGQSFTDFQLTVTGLVGGSEYLLQIGGWSGPVGAGSLEISNVSGGCGPTGSINLLCDPASPHYAGASATLGSSTLGAATGSGLHLECTDGPAGEFGFVLVASAGNTGINVFNGVLCLGSPQGRYNPQIAGNQGLPQLNSIGQFDATGVLQNLAGTATSTGGTGFDVPLELPFSPAGQTIQPMDTYYFQVWYRDQLPPLPNPGSSANFSNMAEVIFP